MSACNVDVIRLVGKYLNVPVGPVCYNTDKVLTTVLDKQNVEGFATIVLRLASKSGNILNVEQKLTSYQWLEYFSMYANQASHNPSFAKSFLQEINKALERDSYLCSQRLTVTDVAAYHVLYTLLNNLSIAEKENLIHLCRWCRHLQAQPQVTAGRAPIPLDSIFLSILAPAVH